MDIIPATREGEWESFLRKQPWSPFLQSWTMGEVYRKIGEEPIRLVIEDGEKGKGKREKGPIVGICQAIVVPAKRGRHLAVPYGPVFDAALAEERVVTGYWLLVTELRRIAKGRGCAFIRVSPFWISDLTLPALRTPHPAFRPSPLHMLAEHIWYLDLRGKSEEDILAGMRKTTRNLVRRAEREGIEVSASDNPVRDFPIFLGLYEETRKRHRFVPYPEEFIRAQVGTFANRGARIGNCGCTLYIARFRGEPVAASIHMIYGGETSYHHGASSSKHPKAPASYLLQWRSIRDALRRGDRIYNFWGIAPVFRAEHSRSAIRDSQSAICDPKHPFAGVTTFKTGFGGQLLELQHCMDLPLSKRYWITYGIETLRKWKRRF